MHAIILIKTLTLTASAIFTRELFGLRREHIDDETKLAGQTARIFVYALFTDILYDYLSANLTLSLFVVPLYNSVAHIPQAILIIQVYCYLFPGTGTRGKKGISRRWLLIPLLMLLNAFFPARKSAVGDVYYLSLFQIGEHLLFSAACFGAALLLYRKTQSSRCDRLLAGANALFGLSLLVKSIFNLAPHLAGAVSPVMKTLSLILTTSLFCLVQISYLWWLALILSRRKTLTQEEKRQRRMRGYQERYGLTPRETEILCLLAAGKKNGEIEEELCISKATVKTHINRLFSKCGVRDRLELIFAIAPQGPSEDSET